MKDDWRLQSASKVILKLCHTEQTCVCHLKPTSWLHDTQIISTFTTRRFLSHAKTYNIQKINSHRMNLYTVIKTENI